MPISYNCGTRWWIGSVNSARAEVSSTSPPLLSSSEATLVATAISELARNIVNYAKRGEIHLGLISNGTKRGLSVVARDQGPGIADIRLALQAGYSTSGGLGLGLPGVRRIMDEFDIASEPGRGTTITVIKWKRR